MDYSLLFAVETNNLAKAITSGPIPERLKTLLPRIDSGDSIFSRKYSDP
jgi:hypothetical protein